MNNYFKQKNASDKYCPTCGKKTVVKDMRSCYSCKQHLYWDGDDAGIDESIKQCEGWYLWHRDPTHVLGWYNQSFWQIKFGGEAIYK